MAVLEPAIKRDMILTDLTRQYSEAAHVLPGDYQTPAESVVAAVPAELRGRVQGASAGIES